MLFLFPRDVLDEICDLIESVSDDFPTYFCKPVFSCLFLPVVYVPEGTSGGLLKSHRPSVRPSVRYKSYLSDSS